MNTLTTILPLLLAAALPAAVSDAHAGERMRGRVVAHGIDGGRYATVHAAGAGPHGAYARSRHAASGARGDAVRWRAIAGDREGNLSGRSGGSLGGVHGGSALRQGSFQRHADGSAGRQGSLHVDGRHGGHLATAGGIARDADGHVSGSRTTDATGRHGNHYSASTTIDGGTVTRTVTCTSATGEPLACRR